jgi:YesN/AraC family two-component response regulator
VSGEAIDGRDAVALARKMKPDIAIVDYSMPVMNGLDVSRRIKSYRLSTEVLIVVSAQAMAFETRRMGVGF